MNILYGVQTTGNGHINKSREIIKELKKRNHKVDVVFSGGQKDLFGIKEFEPYERYKGLTFITENGNLKFIKTVLNINLRQFREDIETLTHSCRLYDIIISDFEPITAKVAKRLQIPSINLSHQACFYNRIPMKFPVNYISLLVARNFARCKYNIGVHWDRFGSDSIITPIFENNLQSRIRKNKYLVYLPFENLECTEILKNFPDYHFCVYNPFKSCSSQNIRYRVYNRETFLSDLEEAEGIITNGGFELICEALSIGKKIYMKPTIGQMEQESNAKCIEYLGYGVQSKKIDEKSIGDFLEYGKSAKVNYPNTTKIFVDWLEEGTFNVKNLVDRCWMEVR